MNTLPPNEGRSWWLREALARPEFAGEPCPPLESDTKADVVILGGGYTGMWTAWFLKELDPGLDVVLLEQDICGGGPSGRNGGFVNSFWDELDFLAERYGDAAALRICRAGRKASTTSAVLRRPRDRRMVRGGRDLGGRLLDGADRGVGRPHHGGRSDGAVRHHHRPVAGRGPRPGRFARLPRRRADESRRDRPSRPAGARVCAASCSERGVRIHEGTHVSRFGAGDPAIAVTAGGTVRAGAAVLAMNAWAQHWRRFKRAITVRGSYIVLTAPAPDRLAAINWTTGMGVSD